MGWTAQWEQGSVALAWGGHLICRGEPFFRNLTSGLYPDGQRRGPESGVHAAHQFAAVGRNGLRQTVTLTNGSEHVLEVVSVGLPPLAYPSRFDLVTGEPEFLCWDAGESFHWTGQVPPGSANPGEPFDALSGLYPEQWCYVGAGWLHVRTPQRDWKLVGTLEECEPGERWRWHLWRRRWFNDGHSHVEMTSPVLSLARRLEPGRQVTVRIFWRLFPGWYSGLVAACWSEMLADWRQVLRRTYARPLREPLDRRPTCKGIVYGRSRTGGGAGLGDPGQFLTNPEVMAQHRAWVDEAAARGFGGVQFWGLFAEPGLADYPFDSAEIAADRLAAYDSLAAHARSKGLRCGYLMRPEQIRDADGVWLRPGDAGFAARVAARTPEVSYYDSVGGIMRPAIVRELARIAERLRPDQWAAVEFSSDQTDAMGFGRYKEFASLEYPLQLAYCDYLVDFRHWGFLQPRGDLAGAAAARMARDAGLSLLVHDYEVGSYAL